MKNLIFLLLAISLMACNNETAAKQDKATAVNTVKTPPPTAAPVPKANEHKVEGGINWMSLEEAQAAASKNPKKIIVDVYTSWCGPCKMMDRNTFSKPDVVEVVNKNFYAVKFNGESQPDVTFKGKKYSNPGFDPKKAKRRNSAHELTKEFSIRGYPTLKVFDANLELVTDLVGYKSDVQLLEALKTL